MRRDGFVGQQHELLDEPVRDVALGAMIASTMPLVVDDDFRLLEIEVDRAAAAAARRCRIWNSSRIVSNIGTSGA